MFIDERLDIILMTDARIIIVVVVVAAADALHRLHNPAALGEIKAKEA